MRVFVSLFIASVVMAVSHANVEFPANWILQTINKRQTRHADSDRTPNRRAVDCKTRDNKHGICVLYYECKVNTGAVIEDEDDDNIQSQVTVKGCPHYMETCCKEHDIVSIMPTQTNEEEGESKFNIFQSRSGPLGCDSTSNTITTHVADWSTNTPQCGWSNPLNNCDQNTSKTDGQARFGDFPWMVALLKKNLYSNVWSQADYLGGGTLIHPSVVMTVAHKLTQKMKSFEPNELKCRAGEWDVQIESELFIHQERDVAKFIKHENYYRTSLYNDIVLLVLTTPFELANAPHIGIGCISASPPPYGSQCYSMGWGRDDPTDKKRNALVLKKVRLNIVEHAKCQQMLRENSRLGRLFELHESLTCASGNEGEDSCKGDGGSPLVCTVSNDPSETRYAVHGMVAYGVSGKCFDPSVPGVYVDTVHLRGWVDEQMRREGFGTKHYTM